VQREIDGKIKKSSDSLKSATEKISKLEKEKRDLHAKVDLMDDKSNKILDKMKVLLGDNQDKSKSLFFLRTCL
jgi:uncharacterized protein YoxC